jgi:hypothetical protein
MTIPRVKLGTSGPSVLPIALGCSGMGQGIYAGSHVEPGTRARGKKQHMGKDSDRARRERAEARRARAVLRRTHLSAVEADLYPLRGPEAISLVTRLSRESWLLGGRPFPEYRREDAPIRFVPRRTA